VGFSGITFRRGGAVPDISGWRVSEVDRRMQLVRDVAGDRYARLEELLWRQIARLPPIEDRLGDIRREIAEANEAREVGAANTFPLGECSKGDAFTLGECRVEPARPENQPYQSRIRFRGGNRSGAVDHHSDLPPGAAQPYRYRQKLGFLVVGALR
jgi:hypothetical protein